MKGCRYGTPYKEYCIWAVCLLIITFCCWPPLAQQIEVPVLARTSCTEPPTEPKSRGWPHNITVNVKIDSAWSETDRSALQAGNQQWNSWDYYTCSGVTFTGFQPQTFQNYDEIPPEKTIYWQKVDPQTGYNAGVFKHYFSTTVGTRVKSVQIKVNPNITNNMCDNACNYFHYLGTHEVAHTFALANCDGCPNGSSIMGGMAPAISTQAAPLPATWMRSYLFIVVSLHRANLRTVPQEAAIGFLRNAFAASPVPPF